MGFLMQEEILNSCKTYHYLTSISWKHVLFVSLLMGPDINPIDTQLGMILRIWKLWIGVVIEILHNMNVRQVNKVM